MRRWFEHIVRGPVPAAVLLSLGFAAIGVQFAPADGDRPEPVFYETSGALSPEAEQEVAKRVVGAHESASTHHALFTKEVRAHLHRTHDETVLVLAGEGRITIGDVTRDVRPGVILLIPRGTPHALEVTGEPVEAVSVFSPPFDGKDRYFVD